MSKRKIAKTTEEFDRRFDEGEDIHDLIDISKAKIIRQGKKILIKLSSLIRNKVSSKSVDSLTGEMLMFSKFIFFSLNITD